MGVMLLVGLLLMLGAGLLSAVTNSEFGGFEAILIGFIYVILAVLYLFPVYYLYRFADGIKKMFHVDLAIGMEEALNYQKSFWRFVGILTLIFIILQVAVVGVIIVFVVLGAIGASSGQL